MKRSHRKALITVGLILLWSLAVIAVVFAEAFLIGPTAVPRGELAEIENHLVEKLSDAAAKRNLGSAALVLLQRGCIGRPARYDLRLAGRWCRTGWLPHH